MNQSKRNQTSGLAVVALLFLWMASTPSSVRAQSASGAVASGTPVEFTTPATQAATSARAEFCKSLTELRRHQHLDRTKRIDFDIHVRLTFAAKHWSVFFVQETDNAAMVNAANTVTAELSELPVGTILRLRGHTRPHDWSLELDEFQIIDETPNRSPQTILMLESSANTSALNGLVSVTADVIEVYADRSLTCFHSSLGFVPIEVELYEAMDRTEYLSSIGHRISAEGAVCSQHLKMQEALYLIRLMRREQLELNVRHQHQTQQDVEVYIQSNFDVYQGQVLVTNRRDQFLLRTGDESKWVNSKFSARVNPGDAVTVFCEKGSRSPEQDHYCRLLENSGPAGLPPPKPIALDELVRSNAIPGRVEVDGTVREVSVCGRNVSILLQQSGAELRTVIPLDAESLGDNLYHIGDRLRVCGAPVRHSTSDHDSEYRLHLASLNDIQLLRRAAGYDFRYLLALIFGTVGLTGCVLIWNRSLSRQVAVRTSKLNELTCHLRQAFDVVREGVLVTSPVHRVVNANRQFATVFGFIPDENEHLDEVLVGIESALVDRESFRAFKARVLANPVAREQIQVELHSPYRIVAVFGGGMLSDEGIQYGTLWAFEDITENLNLENALVQSQKMQAVGQLSSGVAHDFNNLLAVIRSSLAMIQTSVASNRPIDDYAEAADMAIDRAAELTRDLLDFSRRSHLVKKVVDANELLQRAFALARRSIDASIEMQLIPYSSTLPIRVDPTRFEQVLINLCINARDSLIEGEGVIRLGTDLVDHDSIGNAVRIYVSDNGCGMSDEVRQHAFEPFFTTKEPGAGTGLGLAVAAGVIDQLGGEIRISTKLGVGTRMEIFLPCETSHTEEVPAQKGRLNAVEHRSLKVLLVDDEEAVRVSGRDVLESLGHSVQTACNGNECLDWLERESFDGVLLDLTMPVMNGLQALEIIRERWPDVYVVICTGYATDAANAFEATQLQSTPIIRKPYRSQDLQAALLGIEARAVLPAS